MARDVHASSRQCCDGGCQSGGTCPAFAPGVISGPHARRQRMRKAAVVLTWLMAPIALMAVVVLLAPLWVRWL